MARALWTILESLTIERYEANLIKLKKIAKYILLYFLGFLEGHGEISPFYIFLPLLHWICLVRVVIGQALLHETILPLRLDPCCSLNCRYPKLFNYS